MLPPFMKKHRNKTGDELLKLRAYTGDAVLPTIMALYGQQHDMSCHTLETKGYDGHFFEDSTGKLPGLAKPTALDHDMFVDVPTNNGR